MSKIRTERRELIQGVLKKHPKAPARTLARYLVEQYPAEFVTVERARTSLRYYLGATGKRARDTSKKAGTSQHHRRRREAGVFTIPKGVRQARRARHFRDPGKWLVLSDLHCPYHDETAVEAALRFGVDQGCANVLINGDLIDFYKISRFDTDPRHRDVDQEIDTARAVKDEIARHFRGRRVFKVGNHDERLERLLRQRAPELLGVKDFQLRQVLQLTDWDVVESRQLYFLGRLPMFHGHELPRGLTSPVNVARGIYLRVKEPALAGHWHQTSTHVESSGLKSSIATCYSTGCLCDLSPEYALVNRWNHGFALVHVGANGSWNVANCTIDRGTVYATG